ncbi:Na(+)/H(+) antiporter NhaC [Neobacillus rhizosphaerae]|uniref:Na(+)/H(+) antiporter NhaC n=1 Tax=Neobacillus rhizosphaerae TaxID=2880965 RepID=A0ABM9ERG8_9BACI|nr:Na+/H+ antiporter NhaC [Neobacillus rhizosphaerae]CAH2714765.1 Na(+)/H(+) antiporter NhaC [Neobacillus rhizosphaerae]
MLQSAKLKLPVWEAAIVMLTILGMVSSGIILLGLTPHLPMIFAIMLLMVYGIIKKVKISDMESGIMKGATTGLGAVYIFFFIGMLISTWMASGTIPTLMFYGFEWFSSLPLYFSVFVVCSIVGTCIGSAFTTSATIGVAFLGMATAMDASLAITAGAIVSGAFLGDKMSPLSDTTNLASETLGVPLFDHIKNMLWTTVPGFIITSIIFFFLSPESSGKTEEISIFLKALQEHSYINWVALIPFVIVVVLALKKVSAIPTLSAGIVSSVIIAFIADGSLTFTKMSNILFSGFVMESNVEQLNSVLSRGGIESMMFSISLVLLALGMGGLLFLLGIIPSLLKAIEGLLKGAPSLIVATACTAIGINFFVGEQYLSILLTGKTFEGQYEKLGFDKKTLARALEDTGTVINPLVPWGVSGIFLTGVLGVSTLEYVPFAFFCLLSPLLTIFSGITQIGISKHETN